MPRRVPKRKPKHTWVTLTQDFVKEWPEVLDGVNFTNLPTTSETLSLDLISLINSFEYLGINKV